MKIEIYADILCPWRYIGKRRLAADHGLADTMMERLLRAYHTESLNVAEPQTLERLGNEAGLDPTDVRTLLCGDDYADHVRADERRAAQRGITGVPSLVINGQPPVPGVQTPEELRRLLNQRLTALDSATPAASTSSTRRQRAVATGASPADG